MKGQNKLALQDMPKVRMCQFAIGTFKFWIYNPTKTSTTKMPRFCIFGNNTQWKGGSC